MNCGNKVTPAGLLYIRIFMASRSQVENIHQEIVHLVVKSKMFLDGL